MIDLRLKLQRYKNKPIVRFEYNNTLVDCLIDTGAHIPIWTLGDFMFEKCFKDNFKQTNKTALICGFGNGINSGRVYEIEKFVLQDTWNGNELAIHNLPIAVMNRADMSYELILSATVFNKSRVTFDYLTDQPYMRIEAERDLYARYRLATGKNIQMNTKQADTQMQKAIKEACQKGNIVDSIYVFTQDEADSNYNLIESLDF